MILFVLTGECFVCEQKQNFAFRKNSYRLFACLFSLSIKIFFIVAGLSKAKMSGILILTFGHGEFMGTSHDRPFITTRVFFCSI